MFWARVTGFGEHPQNKNEPGDPEGLLVSPDGCFNLLFVQVPVPPAEKQGRRLDLVPVDRTQDAEVARLLRIGATLVADHRPPEGRGLVVLADPEGNQFSVEPGLAEGGAALPAAAAPAAAVATAVVPAAVATTAPVGWFTRMRSGRFEASRRGVSPMARVVGMLRREVVGRLGQLIRLALLVVEALIVVRVIFKVAGANAQAGFASFVYKVTGPFVNPFHPVFADQTVNGHPFEVGSLLAMAVYAVLAALVVRVARLIFASYR